MKLNHIYSLVAGAVLMLGSCTPDDYDFGGAQYSGSDLVAPKAYTVDIKGNKVHLASKISGCTPLWITPTGRSQSSELTVELPFAGDYEVTFGVDTRSGAVYGEPYKFTLEQNDFGLLSDDKWFYLADKDFYKGSALPDAATLATGVSKKWYPCDADYGLGCTGPVMYMSPYDPDNDGAGFTADDEANLVYKDITFGRDNWAPNWDPGFQSWLIPETDPYMDSYMEFSMDAKNGCVVKVYRGESGTKGASTGTNMTGKFNLALADKAKPAITFSDSYALHNVGFDAVCANYTQDIQIIELTPYYLSLVTRRTNSEGNWYIVWNFVSEEVIRTAGACIPKEDAGLIDKAEPKLPEFANLTTDLFTIEADGVTYVGNQMTFTIDEETPYDWMWWNGAPGVAAWQSVTGGAYTANWAPKAGDEIADFELVIAKASDGTYDYTAGTVEGKVTIADSKLTFDQEVTILTAANDFRTVSVTGREFTVLGCEPGESLTIGVPSSADDKGNTDSYLVAKLKYKQISGGQTGPTVVPLNSNYGDEGITWIENGCVRLAFHHYGEGGNGIFKDAAGVKLKKDQTIKVTFKLKDGVITWSQTPKCALIDNNIKSTWEPGCFDLDDAVTVNTGGETTVTLKNTTGATQKFTNTCLDLSIQFDGYGEGDYTDMFESVSCVIE